MLNFLIHSASLKKEYKVIGKKNTQVLNFFFEEKILFGRIKNFFIFG